VARIVTVLTVECGTENSLPFSSFTVHFVIICRVASCGQRVIVTLLTSFGNKSRLAYSKGASATIDV